MQKPVAAFDVAKKFSVLCVLSPTNDKFIPALTIQHTQHGFQRLANVLKEVEAKFGQRPVCVMEATGHYFKPLSSFLTEAGYEVAVVNPLQSDALSNVTVRGVKTDKIAAHHIALLYRLNVTSTAKIPEEKIAELRTLCRQYFSLSDTLTEFKNRARAAMDQIFPSIEDVFADQFGAAAIALMLRWPTTDEFLSASPEEIVQVVARAARRSPEWARACIDQLKDAAKDKAGVKFAKIALAIALKSNLNVIQALQAQLTELEKQIQKIAQPLEGYHNLISMPGMGPITAATILGEIGDHSWFKNARQLVAFSGVDPTVKQSGTFNATRMRMSKRGSAYLRRALYILALGAIRSNRNGVALNTLLRDYYQGKLAQGKAKKVALGAVMRKLVHHIYAVLKNGKPYEVRDKGQETIHMAA